MKGSPTHEAEWQPKRDFVDSDGTLNEAFKRYISTHGLYPELLVDEDVNQEELATL